MCFIELTAAARYAHSWQLAATGAIAKLSEGHCNVSSALTGLKLDLTYFGVPGFIYTYCSDFLQKTPKLCWKSASSQWISKVYTHHLLFTTLESFLWITLKTNERNQKSTTSWKLAVRLPLVCTGLWKRHQCALCEHEYHGKTKCSPFGSDGWRGALRSSSLSTEPGNKADWTCCEKCSCPWRQMQAGNRL